MNRFHLLAVATILIFTSAAAAQQAATSSGNPAKGMAGSARAGVPTAETQLKFLTGKLDLTSDQQEKIKPALQELHGATVRLVQDEAMPREQRLSKIRESRFAADKKIRAVLTDDQKAKLDQVEQEPHSELHGNISGAQN